MSKEFCCDDMKEAINQNWIAIEGLGGINYYRIKCDERPKAKWKRLIFYHCLFCGRRIKDKQPILTRGIC